MNHAHLQNTSNMDTNTIDCKVVMLPTKDNVRLNKYLPHNKLVWIAPPMRIETLDDDYQAQHLYFTSDEEIKKSGSLPQEGTWCYRWYDKSINQHVGEIVKYRKGL